MTRRVVVTGAGVIAPNGRDLHSFGAALAAGRSAVRPIRRFSAAAYPTRIAAEIDDFEWNERLEAPAGWETFDRIARFACAAAAQAVADAELDPSSAARTGVSMAAGYGRYDHEEVFTSCSAAQHDGSLDWSAFHDQFRRTVKPRPAERRTPGFVPAMIAAHFGFGGGGWGGIPAGPAAPLALGAGGGWTRRGSAQGAVAGGSDSEIYPMGVASFSMLHALSTRNDAPEKASRPFSATRDGFVIGEGAGAMVLEELEHARARGARIYAEILGFGSSCDSFRVTDPHPDGIGAVMAMHRALDQARLAPADVDYINAHGTSTPLNDRIESRAIRQLFGGHAERLAVSSTKSMIGHLTVAAGSVEAIATILAMRDGIVHPTINLDDPDPECDLDFVPCHARPARIDVALSNSFAFGGQCASIALGRYSP